MVRSNRTSATNNNASSTTPASVDALDNIDLDEIFADDGDALFDGLDIDLGNIDEITGNGGGSSATSSRNNNKSQHRPTNPPTSSGPRVSSHRNREAMTSSPTANAVGTDATVSENATKSSRRQLKRKTKYTEYDYDDDSVYGVLPSSSLKKTKSEQIEQQSTTISATSSTIKGSNNNNVGNDKIGSKSKQKKGSSSIVSGNNKTRKKYHEDADDSHQQSSTLTTKNNNRSGSNSSQHASIASGPSAGVAAAGQFGGRNKRSVSSTLTSAVASSSPFVAPKIIKGNKLPLMRSSAPGAGVLPTKKSGTSTKAQFMQHEQNQQQATTSKQRHRIDPTKPSTAAALPSSASVASSSSTVSESSVGSSSKRRLKPPQKEYCGIDPSDTLFYPFMAALPSEPTMKSRKAYSLIDRAHSAFINNLVCSTDTVTSTIHNKNQPSEPICRLLEEAFRDEVSTPMVDPKNKIATISNAITSARVSISQNDRGKLAEDLFGACSLLQKQYDFLRQNAVNMKRWCRQNFDENDYSALYKSQSDIDDYNYYYDDDSTNVTVLESFGRRSLKVRIVCDGFRDPNNKSGQSILMAFLPPQFAPPPPKVRQSTSVPETIRQNAEIKSTSKKRKHQPSSINPTDRGTKVPLSPEYDVPRNFFTSVLNVPTNQYATLSPFERRKSTSDLLSRTAREIDSKYMNRSRSNKADGRILGTSLQKFIDDDSSSMMMNTTGMWKYLELSGYFKVMTEPEVRNCLNEIFLTEPTIAGPCNLSFTNDDNLYGGENVESTTVDRIQSLLLEESDSSESECSEDNVQNGLDDWDFTIIDEIGEGNTLDTDMLNVSELSLDERAILIGRKLGLAERDTYFRSTATTNNDGTGSASAPGLNSTGRTMDDERSTGFQTGGNNEDGVVAPSCESRDGYELDQIGDSMIRDFNSVNTINSLRAEFLESTSKQYRYISFDDYQLQNATEKSLIEKCGQLMKAKEAPKARQDWPITCPSNSNK